MQNLHLLSDILKTDCYIKFENVDQLIKSCQKWGLYIEGHLSDKHVYIRVIANDNRVSTSVEPAMKHVYPVYDYENIRTNPISMLSKVPIVHYLHIYSEDRKEAWLGGAIEYIAVPADMFPPDKKLVD